jgi:CRP-like cAMP-binding protein
MSVSIQQRVANFFTAYPLRVFDRHQIIVRAEEPLPGIFYIIEGRVSQYDITPTGNEVVVNAFKTGAFFPMSIALNDTSNLYFFEASTEVKAHIAPPDDAVQFLKENPEVALDLLARVYRGVDGVLRRMAHLMGGDAQSRLLFELLNAAYRFGEQRKDGSMFVPLKEGDLARHSGLARETVNRNMQALKAAGLLTIAHNGMTIKDLSKLEQLLGTGV